MATGKRNYWLKLREDFLNGETVDFMMQQKDGANYVVLYEMLCMKCLNSKGELTSRIGEILIPFDTEKIQRDCKWFNIDTVRFALELYKKLGLIYFNHDGNLQISNFDDLVGSVTDYAKQKELQRNSKEQLVLSVDNVYSNVHDNVHTDIDTRYTELDIKEKNKTYCTFFESVWELYPNKKGKGQVSDTQKKKLEKIGLDVLSKCITRYKDTKETWKEYQNGSTFFNSGYIDYLDENFTEKEAYVSPLKQTGPNTFSF